MSESIEFYADLRKYDQYAKRLFGVPCPDCVSKLPKAQPCILIPGRRCRIHKRNDDRAEFTDEQHAAIVAAINGGAK